MKICVFTGTRADYGLLKGVARLLDNAPDLEMQLLASGSHLSPAHGMTVEEIESDGFVVQERVEIPIEDLDDVSTARAVGIGIGQYAEALKRLQPDLLLLLGDRYEALAMASAALFMRVPIAHVHGGEVTEGAFDESIRHSITKMSHLHFPTADEYRNRLIQLGENPEMIFQVGSLGVEAALGLDLLSRSELESDLGIALGDRCALATYHPATLDSGSAGMQFEAMLEALLGDPGLSVLLTGANADPGGDEINRIAARYADRYPKRCLCYSSLGQLRYLSAMKACTVVVGNSSSGIIEAPSFGVPTVNIGSRQKGRVRAKSVIDCGPSREEIDSALKEALSENFRLVAKTATNPYHTPGTAAAIVARIRECGSILSLMKPFFDLPLG